MIESKPQQGYKFVSTLNINEHFEMDSGRKGKVIKHTPSYTTVMFYEPPNFAEPEDISFYIGRTNISLQTEVRIIDETNKRIKKSTTLNRSRRNSTSNTNRTQRNIR
jgi:hypothetical protein